MRDKCMNLLNTTSTGRMFFKGNFIRVEIGFYVEIFNGVAKLRQKTYIHVFNREK